LHPARNIAYRYEQANEFSRPTISRFHPQDH